MSEPFMWPDSLEDIKPGIPYKNCAGEVWQFDCVESRFDRVMVHIQLSGKMLNSSDSMERMRQVEGWPE